MSPLAYLAGGYFVFDVLPLLAIGAIIIFVMVLFFETLRGTWEG